MKQNIKTLVLFIVLGLSSVVFPKQASSQQNQISFQVFYDQLSPYGQWVDYPNYGYVWIPYEGSDFVPYSSEGHWIYTNYGWTWMSDYNWGWAPFHYGRWDYDDYYGWFWVPDNEWGPAWVTWRRADGYYGWAPLEPGVSISFSFSRSYNSHNDHWIFVRDRDIERADINYYYVDRNEHDRIVLNSNVIKRSSVDNRRHTTYISGPARNEVQNLIGRSVNQVVLRENNKPGQELKNGQLHIYRPQVKKNTENEQRLAPSRVTNLKDVKQPSERNSSNQQRNANPTDNNRREKQQNAVIPQNNDNRKSQPEQPRNANPADNNRRDQQQNNVILQNNDNRKSQPEQPRNTNPADNSKREQQNVVIPQNNDKSKSQQAQPKNIKQTENNKREQKSDVVQPSKNRKNNQTKESKSEKR
jgi:hypothetical protein